MRAQALSATLTFVAALTLGTAALAQSGVPERMVFQGRLVRADGAPETTPQDLRFTIYGQPSGGSALWTETHMGVQLANGHYAVELGTVTPLGGIFTGDARWIAVSLASQQELGARLPIVSAPYAFKSGDAARLNGVEESAFARTDHTHPVATAQDPGLLSAADKAKLDATPTVFGNGLSATTNGAGARQLDVTFAGSGSATTAARSDHTHASPSLSCTQRDATGALDVGVTATCNANETVTGGGCQNVPHGTNYTLTQRPVANGFECRATGLGTPASVTARAVCCRIP